MAFSDTFHELRRRRRLPMTAWEPKIPSAYIHDIEKKGLLPGPEKLDLIVSVFREVAKEQDAADPSKDVRRLWRDRDREVFVKRVGIDPDVADVFVSLRGLMRSGAVDQERRETLLDIMKYATEQLTDLDEDRQREFLDCLQRTVAEFGPTAVGSAQ